MKFSSLSPVTRGGRITQSKRGWVGFSLNSLTSWLKYFMTWPSAWILWMPCAQKDKHVRKRTQERKAHRIFLRFACPKLIRRRCFRVIFTFLVKCLNEVALRYLWCASKTGKCICFNSTLTFWFHWESCGNRAQAPRRFNDRIASFFAK